MSLNSLLESANPYQSLQSDAAKLAGKWEKTGLLEGLDGTNKNNMGIILENQAKQLVVESSQTGGGAASSGTFSSQTAVNVGGQWAGVALPLVRKVFGQIAAKEFVSVQPMNLPSGLVFYLDFQYGTTKAPFTAGDSLYGDGSLALNPFGNTNSGGLYGAGRFSYSTQMTSSTVSATVLTASWSDLDFDSNFSASAVNDEYRLVSVQTSSIPFVDPRAVKSFQVYTASVNTPVQESAFSRYEGGAHIRFVVSASKIPSGAQTLQISSSLQPTDQYRGDFEAGNPKPNANNNQTGSYCCPEQTIPEINVQMKSSAIVAKTKKLKAVWTPEFAQDLNAYHALDAEAELTSILSEYISLEIDLEILSMLITSAAAGTEVWSAVNNQAFSSTAGDGTEISLGFYNSQGQWFQTLGTKIQKLSNIIHQKTLRGGANFLVCSPTVGTILESIPGFAADSDGDAAKANYAFGVQKVGQLNGRYKVYKNPYMTSNVILLGFRGSQFLESGAVFAPYIPLIMTPLVYDPDTFVPRKGLLTRYAKKMVRPEFYGIIEVAGLNTL
jgi:hypothetical protein|tara:strand:- start:58 stop:1719 length:1662 start_codon:yes stop_codon:yes gene_type:complete